MRGRQRIAFPSYKMLELARESLLENPYRRVDRIETLQPQNAPKLIALALRRDAIHAVPGIQVPHQATIYLIINLRLLGIRSGDCNACFRTAFPVVQSRVTGLAETAGDANNEDCQSDQSGELIDLYLGP
jgi:hypothetical protein